VNHNSSYHAEALAFHASAFVVDGHCDTLSRVLDEGLAFATGDCALQIDRPKLRQGHVNLQVMACWNEPDYIGHHAFSRCMAKIGCFHDLARTHGLRLVTSLADLGDLSEGYVLSLEDAAPCMGSVRHVDALYATGVRMIGLTWNGRNELADGVGVAKPGGLTQPGRELVAHMQEIGIVVDAAHLAEPGFWDLLESSSKPVVVSHANARAVCDHRRNLTDAQIKALAQQNGVLGITYVPAFLGPGAPGIEAIVRHIDHVCELAGPDVVALGSDFDGISQTPVGLPHMGFLPRLTEALIVRGYSEPVVKKILGENWLRVFRANWVV